MDNYLSLIIQIISILASLWGIWYFLLIPKLRYKIDILPVIQQRFPLDNLKVLFANQPVSELSIVSIYIYNKGLGVADNFTRPITIHSNRRILEVQLNKDSINNNIIKKHSISKDGKKISLDVNFINNEDEIKCYCIIDGVNNIDISIAGRCKGCSKIKQGFMINLNTLNKIADYVLLVSFLVFIVIGSSLIKNKIQMHEAKLKSLSQNINQQISEIKKNDNSIENESEK